MRLTRTALRPFTGRVLTGSGLHFAHNHNHHTDATQTRGIIAIRDHMVCLSHRTQTMRLASFRPSTQYFSKAMAEGAGRNGLVKSFGDAPLELKMSFPRNSGGKGDGRNPEQLFAMGYACESRLNPFTFHTRSLSPCELAACFLGALQLAAARANKKEVAEEAKVVASVFIGHPRASPDGFGLRAEISVFGCDDDGVISDAHEVRGCRCSCRAGSWGADCGARYVIVLPVQPYAQGRRRDYRQQVLTDSSKGTLVQVFGVLLLDSIPPTMDFLREAHCLAV